MPVVYGVNPTPPRGATKGRKKMAEENPRKKGRRKSKGGGAKKRTKTKTRTKTVTKWRTRNPAKKSRGGGRARARRGFAALDIGAAFRSSIALVGGMIVAKAAVNKITSGGSETELWTWPNIATAALSSFLAAFILGAVFNLNVNITRLIFTGGLVLAIYKTFTTKIAPKWGWTQTWFGADEDVNPALLGAGGQIDIFEPIPMTNVGADTYEVVDGYGQNEMLTEMGYAGNLTPYNPTMGYLSPPVPEMGGVSPYPASVDAAAKALVRGSSAYPGSY